MKKIIVLFGLTLFATMSIAQTKKVLATNFFFGFHHNEGRALNIALMESIGREEGFEVTVINQNSQFTPDLLEDHQAIYMQNLTGTNQINQSMKSAIENWVENEGGGIFTAHATLDGDQGEWGWLYENGIYGHYIPHSAITPARMLIDPEATTNGSLHPILDGIGSINGVNLNAGTITGWTEEWFNWNNYFRGAPNLQILLSMDLTSYNCNCQSAIGNDHPALWITEPVGPPATGGSISYFLAGHGPEVHGCSVQEYQNNEGAGCDPLLRLLFKNLIMHAIGSDDIVGCTDTNYVEYDPEATVHDQSFCQTVGLTFDAGTNIQDFGLITPEKISLDLPHNYGYQVRISNVNGQQVDSKIIRGKDTYYFSQIQKSGIYMVSVNGPGVNISKRVLLY